jgi:drug/metabolite transporter (DMT)-like permease
MNSGEALRAAIMTGFLFGIWPLFTRVGSYSATWLALLISLGTLIVCGPLVRGAVPDGRSILAALFAGVCNGLGMITYSMLLRADGVDVSKYAAIALALLPLFTVGGFVIFFGDPLTGKKIAGLILACIATYLLAS